MNYVFTLDSVFLQVGSAWDSEPIRAQQTCMFYSYIFLLTHVNETIYLLESLPFFKIHANRFMAGMTHLLPMLSQNACCGWGAWCHWVLRHLLSLINSLLIGYNTLLKASRGALFLPPLDVYVRSFLYLFYALIKHYFTKALRDQASSLDPGWFPLLWRPRIPAPFTAQQRPFSILQLVLYWVGFSASFFSFTDTHNYAHKASV